MPDLTSPRHIPTLPCHTDLRARGFLRTACLGFLVKATRRRRENAVLLSKLGHQADFHGRQLLRDGAPRLGCLSDLLEGGGVDPGNLAFGFELDAGDRETSRYRAEMDRSFRMDACRCVALLRQRRRESHRETRRVSGGDKLLRVCAGAVLETRVVRISSLESAAAKLERAGAVLQVAAPFSVGNSLCHCSLHSKGNRAVSGDARRDAHDQLAE